MTTEHIEAESLLVVDVGSNSTRAMLFDVVDGRYRYLGTGKGPTTETAPYLNIAEGVRIALDQLKAITGREFVGTDEQLISPSSVEGYGVDAFVATLSVGTPLKIVIVGLLESVSVESARRIGRSTYGRVVDVISLNDQRKPEERIDSILHLRPDVIIIAGGTDDGASQSVLNLVEAVGLACYLLPEGQRPKVLFVGNKNLRQDVESMFGEVVKLYFAPNVRPTLEIEQLDAPRAEMAKIFSDLRSEQLTGVSELSNWSKGKDLIPTSSAYGRVIQFLSMDHSPQKGVLGIDVGASAITIGTAYDGYLSLGIYPHSDNLAKLSSLTEPAYLDKIKRWLMIDLPDDAIQEYLLQKSLYPKILPAVPEDLAIEQALLRVKIRRAIQAAGGSFPQGMISPGDDLLPWVEPIIATGSGLIDAPDLSMSILALLDGLQPTGVTTLILDQNMIAAALGAAATINPLLLVQILNSNAFLHVGTVIAPVGNARSGTPILRLKISYESGNTTDMEIKQGAFEVITIPRGQSARLQLQPLNRFDIGMGAPGRGGGLKITGGEMGVIIDARGRPLSLSDDMIIRADEFQKWRLMLGGRQ